MLEWKRNRRDEGDALLGGRQFAPTSPTSFVVTKRDELRMPQVIAVGPFRVLDLRG